MIVLDNIVGDPGSIEGAEVDRVEIKSSESYPEHVRHW